MQVIARLDKQDAYWRERLANREFLFDVLGDIEINEDNTVNGWFSGNAFCRALFFSWYLRKAFYLKRLHVKPRGLKRLKVYVEKGEQPRIYLCGTCGKQPGMVRIVNGLRVGIHCDACFDLYFLHKVNI